MFVLKCTLDVIQFQNLFDSFIACIYAKDISSLCRLRKDQHYAIDLIISASLSVCSSNIGQYTISRSILQNLISSSNIMPVNLIVFVRLSIYLCVVIFNLHVSNFRDILKQFATLAYFDPRIIREIIISTHWIHVQYLYVIGSLCEQSLIFSFF